MRRLTILSASLLTVACYRYASLETPAALEPGSIVRVEVSDAGTAGLVSALGTRVTNLEGTVVAATPDSVVIALSKVRRREMGEAGWSGEQVTLTPLFIRAMQLRSFSRQRSAWAVGAALVATAGGFIWIRTGSTGGGGGGGGGGPPPP
jgi:hypothetical protein